MTGKTFRRELGRCMRRIGCLVIIIQMASYTGVRGGVVIPVVTSGTIIGNNGMGAVQRIYLIVNGECCRLPARFRGVAGSTGVWNAG